MNMVKLTKKDSATVIFVNADKITALDDATGGGTRIVFDELFAYVVSEPLDDVVIKMLGCKSKQ